MTRAALALLLFAIPAPSQAQGDSQGDSTVLLNRIVAVVGDRPILQSVLEREYAFYLRNASRARPDSATAAREMGLLLNVLIDNEVMLQVAENEKLTVPDEEIEAQVEGRIAEARRNFASEREFVAMLRQSGFASVEEYRSFNQEMFRRSRLPDMLGPHLQRNGKLPLAQVPDSIVNAQVAAEMARAPRKRATVSFRQLIVPTKASPAARTAARAKAESLLVLVQAGADFDSLARRESMDSLSRARGGDLDWQRRGKFVAEFDQWLFALDPGRFSPVVETGFGFHIIKVERRRTAEVLGRHILIVPATVDSDTLVARARGDSAVTLLRSGVSFDSVVARFNDPTVSPSSAYPNYPADSLPPEYAAALAGLKVGDITAPFSTLDRRTGRPAYVVAVLTGRTEEAAYTEEEIAALVRRNLQSTYAMQAFLERTRKQMHIRIFP
jgi:peptidyl-prolyl cis-trans isomerase SurA